MKLHEIRDSYREKENTHNMAKKINDTLLNAQSATDNDETAKPNIPALLTQ